MTYDTGREQAILSLLRESGESGLSASEICARLTPDGKGKSTVFRLLSALVARGTLRKLPDGQGRRFTYQYAEAAKCRSHLHLKCTECGKFVHLTDRLSELVRNSLLCDAHFAIDETKTLLFGRCEHCAGGTAG